MKNLYDPIPAEEIAQRIDRLSPESAPGWGTMQAAQMLAHCSAFQDIPMGRSFPPRGLLGRFVGKFASPLFYNDKPLPLNMSTIPTIVIADERDFTAEKRGLLQKIAVLQSDGPEKCSVHPHPFFGRLTPEQWGKGLYKHLDHHLKQFGV
ncbi:DUF1569 domain-containing protein [Saccharibacillus sp. CPCC 101409]|uniref:DUF1569 domain-containing protein n=1 Tax=Saccharibacillus sp. CPCC 101409 TaxID=3058041 RepID=UPI0026738CFD|nr:DUF1569 domain-containing protein [Saccharibacillus sp. CPCC 101409]MDO3410928.1 DUF1569 domain-containing protein [Saccharibacillus sp. CPCC 101409]